MSVAGKLIRALKTSPIHVSNPAAASLFAAPGAVTTRGQELLGQPEQALRQAAVYACNRLIAEDVSGMPIDLVEKNGRFRKQIEDHPLLPFLTDEPNDEMDAPEMWRQSVGWMGTRGNGYVYIDYDNRTGKVTGLWPMPASRVLPARDTKNRLMYVANLQSTDRVGDLDPTQSVGIPAEQVMHFRNFGLGLVGLSPIQQAAETVALAMNAEEYAAMFFENGALPGGVIISPTTLDDDQWELMNARWRKMHQGTRLAHITAILEGGAKWETTGATNAELQFLELRGFQIEDIARLYGVPPSMIGAVSKSTSWGTGIEQQHIGYTLHTLMPPIRRIERVVRKRLLGAGATSMRFNTASMLRGDTAARFAAYAIGRQWGWLSVNDIHALEDMDPVVGGDTYLVPLNMAPIGQDGMPQLPASVTSNPDGTPVDPTEARARLARLLTDYKTFELPAATAPTNGNVPVTEPST